MNDINFLFSGERKTPKKLLDHCIVCSKKKNLVYYATTNDFILQICHKCLDANCVGDASVLKNETKSNGDKK